MTYGEEARNKWGMFYYAWRNGWDNGVNGEAPNIPRSYSHQAEKAYRDGYKQSGDITKANWAAIGVAS